MADGPDEAHQLPGDRRADLDLEFAPGFQLPVSGTEPHLGFPGDLLDLLRGALSPALEGSGLPGRVVIGPGRLHQDPSDVAIAGFCDAAAGPGGSAGMLTRDEAQVGHQLGGGPEPVKVADRSGKNSKVVAGHRLSGMVDLRFSRDKSNLETIGRENTLDHPSRLRRDTPTRRGARVGTQSR